mgnify:CR=1 FL=1
MTQIERYIFRIALSAFLADHPGVDVDVDEHTSDEIVGLVRVLETLPSVDPITRLLITV